MIAILELKTADDRTAYAQLYPQHLPHERLCYRQFRTVRGSGAWTCTRARMHDGPCVAHGRDGAALAVDLREP